MFVIFGFLMALAVGCCLKDLAFEIKSVDVEQDVTLTCPRTFQHKYKLFWLRMTSGRWPENLGGTHDFDYEGVYHMSRYTTKQGPGTFILHINRTQMNDSGLYYCFRTEGFDLTFSRGVFLKVKGPQSSISGISQTPRSEWVHPGQSVSLQCSVLSDPEKKSCPDPYRVSWFRAGSDQSHPSLVYADGDHEECGNAPQRCFYNFSELSVSDSATYYCAVAACGELVFGDGTRLNNTGSHSRALNGTEVALCIVCVALAASVTLSVCLIWSNKKKDSNSDVGAASSDQQRDEASVTYSAPTFSRRKVPKAERGNTNCAQKETTYSDLRFK